jgi:hypothetical protein
MKKSVEIYALLVCFFTLMWFAVELGYFFQEIVKINFPEVTQEYRNFKPSEPAPSISADKTVKNNEKMQAAVQDNNEIIMLQAKRNSIRTAINALIYCLISGAIFLIHWKLVRSERLL